MKDAYYFSHDANAHNDPKMLNLRLLSGWEGIGLFWTFLEILREVPEHKYEEENHLASLELRLSTPQAKLQAWLKDCYKVGLLVCEDGFIYSVSFLDRMREMDEKRQLLSEAGRRGGLASSQAKASLKAGSSSKVKESKGKERKDTQPQVLEFLEYFNQKTGKNLSLTDARKKIINDALKFNSINKLKQAVDNFSKDEWPDRRKYMDIIYCIGTIRGINNLDKWATEQPKNAWVKP